jgi:superfamily II DNA or RNA helicase
MNEVKFNFSILSSWSDFTSELEKLNNKEKGDAFELLTKLYFKLSPKYEFYDEVWLLSEVPSKVLEEIGLPVQDLGIDLIAKSGDEYHAIQCKYHSDRNQSVTFKEVSTFTSLFGGYEKLTQGYICSSADLTSRNFNKVQTKPINLILSDSWEELGKEFFDNARAILSNKKIKLDPFKPRDHQKRALREAVKYFDKEGHSRGKLIFPCGAGKSLTGFWMTQKLKSKATIIAVPSLSLVKQTLEVYLREIVANNKKVKWLCICSDEGIGKDEDVVLYTENLGVPCQTDPQYIENWLRENVNQEIVIFTTYQSGRIIAEISQKLDFSFDVGIFDEAHKTVGSDKKLFSHLLFDENISIDKRIFMTATERFYAGKKDDIISMDDESIYGDTFTQMSFKEAIESGLLTDYKVITIDVKKSEIAEFIKENNLVQLNDKWKKETEARSLASMLALRKAMKQFPIKNAVSFHSSIEKAKRNKELQSYITDTYNYQPIDTFTVSGKIPTTKRNSIVQEFAKSSKSLITNARCLTEGVDVPNIDCIVFADPRKSKVDIVQALGRALRKKESKDWGYVILPVVYDETTHEIDNDNFQEILAIVRGLASNDERIVEYFKDKSEKNGVVSDGGSQFTFEVFSDYIDENELSDQLQIKLWDKLSRFNWLPFEEARSFVHNLNLKKESDWRSYCHSGLKPKNIPQSPNSVYEGIGWEGMGDWLGTGNIATYNREYLSFEKAKEFVRNLGIKSQNEWLDYCRSGNKPDYIPADLRSVYKNLGWISLGDFLGTGVIAPMLKKYISFEDARNFARSLNLKSQRYWIDFCASDKKPDYIPSNPNVTYKNLGWLGFGDWLGTGTIATYNMKYRDFKSAREYVRTLNIKSNKEWRIWSKSEELPIDIPASPDKTYKKSNEWQGWGDWLGTNTKPTNHKSYLSFEEAKIIIHKLKLASNKRYNEFHRSGRIPLNIPFKPDRVYKTLGWKGWADFLGKNSA